MSWQSYAIRLSQKCGVYALAREVFQRANPSRRRARSLRRSFYSSLVESNDLCFDVGANVGQTTEVLLALDARVVAVEPNPLCIGVLNQRFGSDTRFHLEQVALGAAPGSAELQFTGTASTA